MTEKREVPVPDEMTPHLALRKLELYLDDMTAALPQDYRPWLDVLWANVLGVPVQEQVTPSGVEKMKDYNGPLGVEKENGTRT